MKPVKSKTIKLINLIGLLSGLGMIVSLVLYQLVVDKHFRRYNLRTWLTPSFIGKAVRAIQYQDLTLGEPAVLGDELTVVCQPKCLLLVEGDEKEALPGLENLELKFYDPAAGLIGYQTVDQKYPTFYVINREPTLLQSVQLNLNDQTLIEFMAYYPQAKKILFEAYRPVSEEKWYYLYSADSPDLQRLETSPQ